jgi:hypothetical protein
VVPEHARVIGAHSTTAANARRKRRIAKKIDRTIVAPAESGVRNAGDCGRSYPAGCMGGTT